MLSDLAQLAASAALSGGVLGGAGSFLGGAKNLRSIGKGAATGAALSGVAIPSSYLAGRLMLGKEEKEEANPVMKRAGLGGLALGGLAGAGLGGLAATGKLGKLLAKTPRVAEFAQKELPTDNLIFDYIKKLQQSKTNPLLKAGGGALIGAGLAGPVVGYQSADEGQQMDTIRSSMR